MHRQQQFPAGPLAMSQAHADRMNQRLVDRLVREGALWSPPLIAAFRDTPRHRFLDRMFQYVHRDARWREIDTRDPGPAELGLIYSDRALITRLSADPERRHAVAISSSSQPSLMAQMLEDLRPERGGRILEVGAGTGYNAALLAHVAGPASVTSIDVDQGVLAEAAEHLGAFPERHVSLKHADGRRGHMEGAPYDRIVVTAAAADIEPAWMEQLADNGVLLAPLAFAPGLAFLARGKVRRGLFQGRLTRPAYFIPLRREGELSTGADGDRAFAVPQRRISAPWTGWFERRRGRGWAAFIQSLVFYALLRGFESHHRTSQDGRSIHGISARGGVDLCWLGSTEWEVCSASAQDLAFSLLRAFLDAGGPRPTEFDLTASTSGGLQVSAGESFLRQGPICQQLWELSAVRERAEFSTS